MISTYIQKYYAAFSKINYLKIIPYFFLLFLVSVFILFKLNFHNLLLLVGDEGTYRLIASDIISHGSVRNIDPSDFPGFRIAPDNLQSVGVVVLSSLITNLSPFYIVNFLPILWFLLAVFSLYLLCYRLTAKMGISLFIALLFTLNAMNNSGAYSLYSWFDTTIPQNFSYIYFLLLNYFIFATDFFRKKISIYDLVIWAILIQWRFSHMSYLFFGLIFYLMAFFIRSDFYYIKALFFWMKNGLNRTKITTFFIFLILASYFLGKKIFLIASSIPSQYYKVDISFNYIRGTVGLVFIIIFFLNLIYILFRIFKYKECKEKNIYFLSVNLLFLILIFIYPFLLKRFIPVTLIYYRFFGFYIVFSYISLIFLFSLISKKKILIFIVSIGFLLSGFPFLRNFDVYAFLNNNLILVGKEKELLTLLDKFPKNSVFINPSVNSNIFISKGFPILSMPCFLEYLYDPKLINAQKYTQWETRRNEIYAKTDENFFYLNIIKEIELCYKYNLDNIDPRKAELLFKKNTTSFREIPYSFFYIQSKKRLNFDYLEKFKSINYPVRKEDLVVYAYYPSIQGQYFNKWYENDEFTIWELKKLNSPVQ